MRGKSLGEQPRAPSYRISEQFRHLRQVDPPVVWLIVVIGRHRRISLSLCASKRGSGWDAIAKRRINSKLCRGRAIRSKMPGQGGVTIALSYASLVGGPVKVRGQRPKI